MIRLSKLEEQIMDTIWDLGKAFPKVIVSKMSQPTPPYNTVLSAIRKLEKQGHIGFEKYGKSHEYFPLLKKEDYTRSLFTKLFHELMESSPEKMVSYFSDSTQEELNKLQDAIENLKNKDHD